MLFVATTRSGDRVRRRIYRRMAGSLDSRTRNTRSGNAAGTVTSRYSARISSTEVSLHGVLRHSACIDSAFQLTSLAAFFFHPCGQHPTECPRQSGLPHQLRCRCSVCAHNRRRSSPFLSVHGGQENFCRCRTARSALRDGVLGTSDVPLSSALGFSSE